MTGFPPRPVPDQHQPASRPGGLAYRSAVRHSGLVRLLKVAIPVGAVVAALAIVLATFLNPLGRMAGLSLGNLSLSGTKITMESPRLAGFRKDAKPYEVTAKAAFQDVRKPGLVELKEMKAKLAIDDSGGLAHLVATGGLFDTAREHLELRDDVRITTTRGDEVLLRSAQVDLKGGTMSSADPVRITTRNGTIEAEGVKVSDNGHTVVFTGRVRTQFARALPEPGDAAGVPARVTQAEAGR